ncbi:hypothetical protein N0B44_24910 [Roseibacterium beibuensis]|uniref:Hemerythrin-like domain-containing protein n=1 Tax=[Roseibacterium] beibuensis TaxID=1193142 RepID=A0ABP9LJM6_9RHOB|nr:hypothetical protein [Roseibacterium beibuensis]MCS6626164.1 hypothetical protein [Roseibacterium beibuensis]
MSDPQDPSRQIAAPEVLLTHLVDARTATDALLPHAEGQFEHLLKKFREEHHQHIQRVGRILFALCQDPDEGGSLKGRAASMLTAIKASFDTPDASDMSALADAGAVLLQEFDAAIRATPANHHRDDLEDMREELAGLVAEARGR